MKEGGLNGFHRVREQPALIPVWASAARSTQ
jgi:hypothetical protein